MVELLRSKLIPAPHGFPTRAGGVSEDSYASLNLGFSVGDDRVRVEQNLSRLADAGGFRGGRLHVVSQVHGDRVVEAPPSEDSDGLRPAFTEADGQFTSERGAVLGIRVADCIPLLIADPVGKRVAAVHSGWKGTDAQIAARAVEKLVAAGSKAKDLVAAIGPHIKVCCYEVSEDLAQRFEAKFGARAVSRDKEKPHLDLSFAVRKSLEQSGVPTGHVDVLPHCTHCDGRFFSHRRDKGVTGRHMAFVVCDFSQTGR